MEQKDVTIYDIARKLKISSATVSRALKDNPVVSKVTRKKIFDLAEELGYRTNNFARNLRTQKTKTIGVIVPRLDSYFMSRVISGIEHVVNSEGYTLIISQSAESSKKEAINAKTLFDNRVDGLLVSFAYDTEDTTHFDVFFKRNIPVVFFDRVAAVDGCTNVLIDNRKAAYEATAHLIKEGYKNVVHLSAIPRRNVYADRLNGYKDALAHHNIKYREDYIIIDDLSQEAGVRAAKQILKMEPRPDAVFVANDNCAVRCMIELKRAGIRIPEDIAFAGFNNDPVSTVVEPHLTTINYPGYTVGEVAARILIDHLNGTNNIATTNTILIRSELIIRESSKKKIREGKSKVKSW